MIVDPPDSPEIRADGAAFEKAHADFLIATSAQGVDAGNLDAVQVYNSLQKLIHARAVTTEQISRKVAILIGLQHDQQNPSAGERLLLSSIKRDLDGMV
jgi:hypothetical protein